MAEREPSFFIGWAPPPGDLRRFLAAVALACLAVFAVVAFLAASTADDPGDGAFRFDWGPQTVTGVLETDPYPMLHVTESERFRAGHTLMLSGVGKTGVRQWAGPVDGSLVRVTGVALKRGDLDMLQVDGGEQGLAAVDGPVAPVAVEPLGRWRLTGEICDGKCYAGAMRPGEGLAHRACANLCLIGDVPAVFVATAPVAGSRFLLMGDVGGGPIGRDVLDHTATLVDVEGEVERRGGLLVFRIDAPTLRTAR
jgi:hypothetical protein